MAVTGPTSIITSPTADQPRGAVWSRPSGLRVGAALVTAGVILGLSRWDLGDGTWIWAVPATVAVALLLTWLIEAVRVLLPAGWVSGLLVAITAIVYACVPETDHIAWIAALPFTIALLELGLRRHLPFGWSYGAAGAVLGAGVYGATGRDSALVGTFFAWWPLALLVIVVILIPAMGSASKFVLAGIVLIGGIAASWVARTGALQPTIGPALRAVAIAAPVSLVVALGIAFGVVRLLSERDGRRAATPRPPRH